MKPERRAGADTGRVQSTGSPDSETHMAIYDEREPHLGTVEECQTCGDVARRAARRVRGILALEARAERRKR